MNRPFTFVYHLAFWAGLAAISWAGASALAHNPIALLMIFLIYALYGTGAWELRRFRLTSLEWAAGLARPAPQGTEEAALNDWLAPLSEPLRDALRQRLGGSRAGLHGLTLAPALAALLVLLGMLGTFIGLVLTLGGTASALSATADLAAMRAALTAPVKGLGLAFGSSVAGVAASAMLGLMVALARRERAMVSAQLDRTLATDLRPFTAAQRRAQAEQTQALALPALVDQLQAFATQMAAQQTQFQSHFQADWLAEQARFHAQTQAVFGELAAAVQRSLQTTLVDSAKQASAALEPAVQACMASIAQEAAALHQQVARDAAQQLQAVGARFELGAEQLGSHWQTQLGAQLQAAAQQSEQAQQAWQHGLGRLSARFQAQAEQTQRVLNDTVGAAQSTLQGAAEQSRQTLQALQAHAQQQQQALESQALEQHRALTDRLAEQASALVQTMAQAQATQHQAWLSGDAERLAQWREALGQSASHLLAQGAQAHRDHLAQQQQLADTLAQTTRHLVEQIDAQSQHLLTEVSTLLRAASETPRAAAEMAAALREQLSKSLAQDNALLAERAEQAQRLQQLLGSAQQAATEQRSAMAALQAATEQHLQLAGTQFGEQVDRLAERFADTTERAGNQLVNAATLLAASSAEMGSLGEGFSAGVDQFHTSNERLMTHLAQLETALAHSGARSEEQLAYTVAQARELIDLCLTAQKQAVDALRLTALHAPQALQAPQAAETVRG
jgi:hypothetical protein